MNDQEIRALIGKLIGDHATSSLPTKEAVRKDDLASVRAQTAKALGPTLSIHEYAGYLVTDRNSEILQERICSWGIVPK